jgi:small redox-active disulfide protein 2
MEEFDMTKIEILGTGCSKCKKLAETVEHAVKELEMKCDIVKVTDINEIMKYGIMMTPALVVNGVVKISGKVPNREECKKLILQ